MSLVVYLYLCVLLVLVTAQLDNGKTASDEQRESLNRKYASPLQEASGQKKALLDHRMTIERQRKRLEEGVMTNGKSDGDMTDARDQSTGAAETPLVRTKKRCENKAWEDYKIEFHKTYPNPMEEAKRKEIFLENKNKVDRHNALCDEGKVTFSLGINLYADMTSQEFNKQMNGFVSDNCDLSTTPVRKSVDLDRRQSSTPAAVDWRTNSSRYPKGCVTAVKDQGDCGSCYAFSSVGAVESIHCIKTGDLIVLSEQQVVDCSNNSRCNGGDMTRAFQYIIDNKGIATATAYPYKAENGTCKPPVGQIGATISSYSRVTSGSESALLEAVYAQPVSVGVDASWDSFQLYREGVYHEANCSQTALSHGMLVVGYGTENCSDYWIVKNSWGVDSKWGEQGYIKMARNKDNNCGIATEASYPIV